MPTFTLNKNVPPAPSTYAVGRNSGTLYVMQSPTCGIVVVGRGVMTGMEGKIHSNSPYLFENIPEGTVITIQA